MQYNQKSRKDKIINHNVAKQAHADIADPTTHLKDAQHMGRYAGNVPRWTKFKQSVKAQDIEQYKD